MSNNFTQALLAFDKKEYANAIALFLNCKPIENTEYSLYLGKAYFLNGQAHEAISHLNGYLEKGEANLSKAQLEEAWDTLGQCYAALNNCKQALVCFKNAKTASAYHNMALTYMKMAAESKSSNVCFESLLLALNFLEEAIKAAEKNPMFFHSLASWAEQYAQALEEEAKGIEQINGAYHKAIENYRMAASLTNDNDFKAIIITNLTECIAQYGHFLYRNEKYKEAQLYYLQVLKQEPLHASANNQMGMSFFKLGEYEQARVYFNQLLRIPDSSDQDFADAWLNIACTYRLEKKWDEAAKALQRASELAPKDKSIQKEKEQLKDAIAKHALIASSLTAFSPNKSTAEEEPGTICIPSMNGGQ